MTARTLISRENLFILSGGFAIQAIVAAAAIAYVSARASAEEATLEKLNTFIDDIYHDQKIVKDGVVPEHMIQSAQNFLPDCIGLSPAHGLWFHITGTELVRDGSGEWIALNRDLFDGWLAQARQVGQ